MSDSQGEGGAKADFSIQKVLDMGCNERELKRYLQVMTKLFEMQSESNSHAVYTVHGGRACIAYKPLPDRRIALARIPRMEVSLGFTEGVPADARNDFVAKFMLYTQRGGG